MGISMFKFHVKTLAMGQGMIAGRRSFLGHLPPPVAAYAIAVITAGFRETGAEGATLESEIAATCRAAGVRLLGPNCLGLINSHHKMNASFAKHTPRAGRISVISQSGAWPPTPLSSPA